MERQMQILAYLIARSISVHTGEAVQEIINEAVAATEEKEREVGEDAVERIYAQYPTRCPVRGTATGKCAKNKAQIRKLLKVQDLVIDGSQKCQMFGKRLIAELRP